MLRSLTSPCLASSSAGEAAVKPDRAASSIENAETSCMVEVVAVCLWALKVMEMGMMMVQEIGTQDHYK